jgi:hypothetical protein
VKGAEARKTLATREKKAAEARKTLATRSEERPWSSKGPGHPGKKPRRASPEAGHPGKRPRRASPKARHPGKGPRRASPKARHPGNQHRRGSADAVHPETQPRRGPADAVHPEESTRSDSADAGHPEESTRHGFARPFTRVRDGAGLDERWSPRPGASPSYEAAGPPAQKMRSSAFSPWASRTLRHPHHPRAPRSRQHPTTQEQTSEIGCQVVAVGADGLLFRIEGASAQRNLVSVVHEAVADHVAASHASPATEPVAEARRLPHLTTPRSAAQPACQSCRRAAPPVISPTCHHHPHVEQHPRRSPEQRNSH